MTDASLTSCPFRTKPLPRLQACGPSSQQRASQDSPSGKWSFFAQGHAFPGDSSPPLPGPPAERGSAPSGTMWGNSEGPQLTSPRQPCCPPLPTGVLPGACPSLLPSNQSLLPVSWETLPRKEDDFAMKFGAGLPGGRP